MERLTTRTSIGMAVYKQPYLCNNCNNGTWRLPDYGNGSPTDKLCEYEDLEERAIAKTGENLDLTVERYHEFLDEVHGLFEYRKLEEQGLLLRLPCKIKDTVYQIIKPDSVTDYTIRKGIVDRIDMQWGWGNKTPRVSIMVKFGRSNYYTFLLNDIGSYLFLTREEAEARLKELEVKRCSD